MDYQEVLDASRPKMGKYCKSCAICNGKACSNHIPGPGAKGSGAVAIRNYEAWQDIYVNMDTICANEAVDTHFDFFGYTLKYPILAGPVGAVSNHYSDEFNDQTYNEVLIKGCKEAGIIGFTGDGVNPDIMKHATKVIHDHKGIGVPTIKPWENTVCFEKLELAKESGAIAVAMDVDAAGLPFLKQSNAGRKSVEQLQEIIQKTPVPFIVKGVMSVQGALKAKQAGAKAIIVSNHGGRVLDGCPATATVLEEIVKAVNHEMLVFVDGGIRCGLDIFKALSLGADAIMIARPFVNAVYGAKEEGIQTLVDKLGAELEDTMLMCGASSLSTISRNMIKMK